MKTAHTDKPGPGRLEFHSLRFQLLSRSLIILAVLLGFIGIIQYVFMRDNTFRNMAVSLQGQVRNISPAAWESLLAGSSSGTDEQPRPPVILMPGTSLAFIDEEGNYALLISDHGFQPPLLPRNRKIS